MFNFSPELHPVVIKLRKIPYILRTEGAWGIIVRIMIRIYGDSYPKDFQKSYEEWYEHNGINSINITALTKQLSTLNQKPLISIITPVYNTRHKHLRECIESVQAQTYENWELLLVNDNSSDTEVAVILDEYAANDSRIRVKHRAISGHICLASNDALQMARGAWIALLDHDDIVWPNALQEIAQVINDKPNTKFIFSDEDKIEENGITHSDAFFKPDWNPHFLWSCNYITHFAAIQTSLVKKIGGFRKGTEGAQDWDLFIRAIHTIGGFSQHPLQQDCQIQHVPKILYSWRKSPTSTASEKYATKAKKYAFAAQEKTLNDYFSTYNHALVSRTRSLGIYHVQPLIKDKTLVSIIIPLRHDLKKCKKLLTELKVKNSYKNCEFILVGNTPEELPKHFTLLQWSEPYNYSAMCNFGAKQARGDVFLFMDDDMRIAKSHWLEPLLGYALQPNVGAVAPRLIDNLGRIYSNGYIISQNEVAPLFSNGHQLQNFGINTVYISATRDCWAVSGNALLVQRRKFEQTTGWNDKKNKDSASVQLCGQLQTQSYFTVLNPNVALVHWRDSLLYANSHKSLPTMIEYDPFFSTHLKVIHGRSALLAMAQA